MNGQLCTFTGGGHIFQQVYICRTCECPPHLTSTDGLEVCYLCARKCHQGHDIIYSKYENFTCNCNNKLHHKSCNALVEAQPKKVNLDIKCKSRFSGFLIKNSYTLKEFKCPVCLSFMCDIIYMCKNGHNMCGACHANFPRGAVRCPVCRDPRFASRNLALETLGRSLKIKCEYCHESVKMSAVNDHIKLCVLSKCPLDPKCTLFGLVRDVYDHCEEKHSNKILKGALHEFRHKFASTAAEEVNLINMNGSLFIFHRKFSTTEGVVFQGVVKSLGPLKESIAPSYTLQFTAPLGGGGESIVMKSNVRPLSEDVEEIYKLHRGVTLYMSQIINILLVDSLDYKLTVHGSEFPMLEFHGIIGLTGKYMPRPVGSEDIRMVFEFVKLFGIFVALIICTAYLL